MTWVEVMHTVQRQTPIASLHPLDTPPVQLRCRAVLSAPAPRRTLPITSQAS